MVDIHVALYQLLERDGAINWPAKKTCRALGWEPGGNDLACEVSAG